MIVAGKQGAVGIGNAITPVDSKTLAELTEDLPVAAYLFVGTRPTVIRMRLDDEITERRYVRPHHWRRRPLRQLEALPSYRRLNRRTHIHFFLIR